MLTNKSESRNFSATSEINSENIAYFGATYNGKDLSFSKSISDVEKYKKNQETVDGDYEEFQEYVIEEIG